MSRYREWVQFSEHGYSTEHDLSHDAGQLGEGKQTDHLPITTTTTPADRSDNSGDDCDNKEKGKKAIAELDPRVESSLCLVWDWCD